MDILFDPESGVFSLPRAFGFYASYEHFWRENLYSNFTYGFVSLEEKSFAPGGAFRRGRTFRFNTFWNVVGGAKIGAEVVWGARINLNEEKGRAFRINLLVYYDF